MASFALFNFEFEPIQNKLRQAELKGMESVLWNWQMGRDLVQKKAEERWGAGIVEQVSIDLRREFPNENGFSTSNLWYMKKWYLFYAGDLLSKSFCIFTGAIRKECKDILKQRSVMLFL